METRLTALDLYSYLRSLADLLASVGEPEASRSADHASRFVSGSASELFGEAKSLLSYLSGSSVTARFSLKEKAKLDEILAGVRAELERIGGA